MASKYNGWKKALRWGEKKEKMEIDVRGASFSTRSFFDFAPEILSG